ncbi:hypothetical protein [Streptomyces sp. NPDC003996]
MPQDVRSAKAAMPEKPTLRHNTVRPFLSLLGKSDALARPRPDGAFSRRYVACPRCPGDGSWTVR